MFLDKLRVFTLFERFRAMVAGARQEIGNPVPALRLATGFSFSHLQHDLDVGLVDERTVRPFDADGFTFDFVSVRKALTQDQLFVSHITRQELGGAFTGEFFRRARIRCIEDDVQEFFAYLAHVRRVIPSNQL